MPCNNLVEQIRVNLDDRDRLTGYRFFKQTCGQDIGASSLLTEFLLGLSVDELLAIDSERLLAVCRPEDDVSRFLHLKHLFAIQAVLEVYTGRSNGSEVTPFVQLLRSEMIRGEVVIDADIDVGWWRTRSKPVTAVAAVEMTMRAFEA